MQHFLAIEDNTKTTLQGLIELARWAEKPAVNMETISHPCQALAMMKTINNATGLAKKRKFVLSWRYHPKPLNNAAANSAVMIAAMFGMDVTIANPEGFDLDQTYLAQMQTRCRKNKSTFRQVHTIEEGLVNANFVYTDEVIDGPGSLVYEEAENTLHVQKAVLATLFEKLPGGIP